MQKKIKIQINAILYEVKMPFKNFVVFSIPFFGCLLLYTYIRFFVNYKTFCFIRVHINF